MRNIIVIKILILSICFSSCRSKKISTEVKETVKIDTVYQEKRLIDTIIITKEKEITKPVYFETIVDCSEDQSGKVGSGGNYTSYVIKDGQMYLKTNIDSVSSYWQSHYRSKQIKDSISAKNYFQRQLDKVESEKVYVYPWWLYAIVVGAILSIIINIYQRFKPI